MKKESKEMLKTIISNQQLIMKALKIEVPVSKTEKAAPSKSAPLPNGKAGKKAPVKKVSVSKTAKKK